MSTEITPTPLSDAILNFEEADFSFILNEAFWNITNSLMMLGALGPSLADTVSTFAEDLTTLSGEITVTDGVFNTNLILPDGTNMVGVFNGPETLETYAVLAAMTNGQATLANGILQADLTTGEDPVGFEGLDLAGWVGTEILSLIEGIEGTTPFVDGAFYIESSSAQGTTSATVNIGGGDLNVAWSSPYGKIGLDVDFDENAVFPFVVPTSFFGNVNAVLDLNAGNVVASLGFFGDVAVPIEQVDGSLTFNQGVATFNTTVGGLGSASVDLAVGPLASEYIVRAVQDLNATAEVTEGVLRAMAQTDAGIFETTFDAAAFTQQGADFFRGVNGLITLTGDNLIANLTTPAGNITDSYSLGDFASLFDVPIGELIA